MYHPFRVKIFKICIEILQETNNVLPHRDSQWFGSPGHVIGLLSMSEMKDEITHAINDGQHKYTNILLGLRGSVLTFYACLRRQIKDRKNKKKRTARPLVLSPVSSF